MSGNRIQSTWFSCKIYYMYLIRNFLFYSNCTMINALSVVVVCGIWNQHEISKGIKKYVMIYKPKFQFTFTSTTKLLHVPHQTNAFTDFQNKGKIILTVLDLELIIKLKNKMSFSACLTLLEIQKFPVFYN